MSVRSLNKVMLIGNLTRDPNVRFTPNNTAVASFSIATNRSWMPSDGGEKQEKADFHNLVAWSKLAEVVGQLLHKGDKVYVEGRLQTREWKNKEGQDQRTTEIVLDNMILLTSRGGAAGSYSNGPTDDVSDDLSGGDTSQASPSKKTKKAAPVKSDEDVSVSDDVAGVEDLADEVDIPF
jgi:single-strand DNA-binding protein